VFSDLLTHQEIFGAWNCDVVKIRLCTCQNEAGIATTRKTKKSYAMLIDFDPCRWTGEQKVKRALYVNGPNEKRRDVSC